MSNIFGSTNLKPIKGNSHQSPVFNKLSSLNNPEDSHYEKSSSFANVEMSF